MQRRVTVLWTDSRTTVIVFQLYLVGTSKDRVPCTAYSALHRVESLNPIFPCSPDRQLREAEWTPSDERNSDDIIFNSALLRNFFLCRRGVFTWSVTSVLAPTLSSNWAMAVFLVLVTTWRDEFPSLSCASTFAPNPIRTSTASRCSSAQA